MLPAQYSLDPLILLHRGFEGANSYSRLQWKEIREHQISFHDQERLNDRKRRDNDHIDSEEESVPVSIPLP